MTAKPVKFRDALEKAKRDSTVQLLFKCSRLLNERSLAALPTHPTGARLRPSHTALFAFVSFEGTRITELAQRLAISKQAVGQLVDELVQMGVFERVDDPSDARAKLVRWTPQGQQGLLHGLQTLAVIESELSDAIGARAWRHLRESLVALHDHLERAQPTSTLPVQPPASVKTDRKSIARATKSQRVRPKHRANS
jgi:DNA-binding MarR family transcriptional regulator